MDRDAKVAAARRKLKKFKRKKENKKAAESDSCAVDNSTAKTQKLEAGHDATNGGTVHDIKDSEGVDERFQVLDTSDCGSFPESTANGAALATGIMQASVKLKGLAAEAEQLVDDPATQSSEENFQIIEHPELDDRNKIMKNLEEKNVELTCNLSSVSQENEELKQQCSHLSKEISSLQAKLNEANHLHDEENGLREQLSVQMQTIGVLVSEKQGLQQELMVSQSNLNNLNSQQEKAGDGMKCMREEIMHLKRDLQSKSQALEIVETNLVRVESEYDSSTQKLDQFKQALEKEQLQSSELASKLQSKEAEFIQLHTAYNDACEKLQMADVLVQQLSVNSDINALTELKSENEIMASRCSDYQQAFQQLTTERENLSLQYNDAQKVWEEQLNTLQERIQSLETEKQHMLEEHIAMKSALEEKSTLLPQETDLKTPEVVDHYADIEADLEEVRKNYDLLNAEMLAQEKNNRNLAALISEKEAHIEELENDLRQAKIAAEQHEQLMIESRNDKVTISRALMQNRQLKEQLEEIQEGFIRMSNDKMDLAIKLSSVEHTNKDLMAQLSEAMLKHEETVNRIEEGSRTDETPQQRLQQLASDVNEAVVEIQEDKVEEPSAGDDEVEGMHVMDNLEEHSEIVQSVHPLEQNHETEAKDVVLLEDHATELKEKSSGSVNEQSTLEPSSAVKMLQEKFTTLMSEKAELLNRLEILEHANTQLQNECDTIGEYIALYHNQRQVLRRRHREKDEYISSIVREREAMLGKIEQLQMLIVSMLSNRQNPSEELSIRESELLETSVLNDQHATTRLHQGQPDLVPETELSIYDEVARTKSSDTLPGRSKKVHLNSESSTSGSEDVTTSQILSLLEEIQKPTDTTVLCQKVSTPSGFGMNYIGPYTAI